MTVLARNREEACVLPLPKFAIRKNFLWRPPPHTLSYEALTCCVCFNICSSDASTLFAELMHRSCIRQKFNGYTLHWAWSGKRLSKPFFWLLTIRCLTKQFVPYFGSNRVVIIIDLLQANRRLHFCHTPNTKLVWWQNYFNLYNQTRNGTTCFMSMSVHQWHFDSIPRRRQWWVWSSFTTV